MRVSCVYEQLGSELYPHIDTNWAIVPCLLTYITCCARCVCYYLVTGICKSPYKVLLCWEMTA